MDLWQAIADRQSVRQFDPGYQVPEADLSRLLQAAVRAPSAGNLQPWFFYVVRLQATRDAFVAAAFGQSFLSQAPVVIVVCAEPERSATRYGDRGRRLYCLQDTANAITNIQLGAVALGLGTCWVGAFDESMVSEILKLPPEQRPVALVPIGRPVRTAPPRPRRPLGQVTRDA